MRYTITAKLQEDTHLGSGSGGLGVNALIARDGRGFPVIWASHLKGLLRAAATALGDDDDTTNRLFGTAVEDRQLAVFTSLYCDHNPTSHFWRSTARASFDNRAPDPHTLRVVEMVPKETSFKGTVELPTSDAPTLLRLLQEVNAVGQGRASGAGRVELSLEPVFSLPARAGSGAPSSRILLLMRNLEPLCVAATATPGNIIPTEPYVPGRTLLGALAKWLLTEKHSKAASLLVSEKIQVSDALPLPQGDLTTSTPLLLWEVLPAPLALQSEKPQGSGDGWPWWAAQEPPVQRRSGMSARQSEGSDGDVIDGTDRSKLKRPEADLFLFRAGEEKWQVYRPQRRVRMRSGRPDPDREEPLLFAIEQVAERTHFLAELRGAPADLKELSEALRPVLEGRRWLRVGRAGAPVEVVRREWAKDERAVREPARSSSEPQYLTLTSDLLMRDEWLRWRTTLDAAALGQLLDAPSEDFVVQAHLQEESAVHGFNGTARLWRLPAAAVRRGSVFKIAGPGIAKLLAAAAAGSWLGERTHEGFGRFRVDAELPGLISTEAAPSDRAERADSVDEARCGTTRQWLRAHKALAVAGGGDRRPSLSQWQDLVSELAAGRPDAIDRRLDPKTAGAASWRHPDAEQVLKKLRALPGATQTSHARMFLRWLRAEMRATRAEVR